MNRTWYEVKVKYTKQLENGTIKRVTEPYLVDAVSFTESEARIYKEVCETCQGECSVEAIKKDNIVDIFLYEDSDVWYRCTINRIDYDDESGKERKVKEAMMVTASSVQEAAQRIHG